jgi:hypothetical protein
LYPETKGPSLEEVAVMVEGADAKVGGLALGDNAEKRVVQQIERA